MNVKYAKIATPRPGQRGSVADVPHCPPDDVSRIPPIFAPSGPRPPETPQAGHTMLTGCRPRKGHAMRDDPSVIALVCRVAGGDQVAWNELIERYSPLVWSICLRYQLDSQEIDDVGQSVWLLLVEHIGSLREPAALPGWLATTTKHECLRALRAARRRDLQALPLPDHMPLGPSDTMIEHEVIKAERDAALRMALAELPPNCHDLLSMLISDPPPGYAQISATLGIPMGSIGPTRARCLERLRRSPHVTAVLGDQAGHVAVREAGR
jgi:RNA polymerase sigma factor (sigma-70 family)